MLTQRFGIFWRPFHFSFDRWPLVVLVTMKLHNLCMDKQCNVPPLPFAADVQPGDVWAAQDNFLDDDWLVRERASGACRRDITAKLQHLGILRPMHATMNSRC
jgi:hypothetical protein